MTGAGPYYEDELVALYHGDARDVLPRLRFPGRWALVMDPPYGIAHASNHGASWEGREIAGDRDTALRDWALTFCAGWPAAVFGTWKVPRPEGARAVLVWDKGPASGMGDLSFPWKGSHEEICILGAGWTGRRDEGVLKGHRVLTWETRGRRHPHEKPVSLLEALIHKLPGRSVLDPFAGSGSTLAAAKNLGRRAVGVELAERYCAAAAERLSQGVLPLEAS